MSRRLGPTACAWLLSLCLLGLGFMSGTGCEKSKSGGDEPAEAQKSTGSEPATEASTEATSEQTPGNSAPSVGGTGTTKGAGGADEAPATSGATQGDGEKISDAELEKFVRVAELLDPKSDALMKQVEGAETEAEAEQVQKMLKQEARKAAEKAGLSYKRFQVISQRMKNDASLERRIRELMAERASGEQK